MLIKAFCEINTRECEGFICLEQDGTASWKTVLYDTLDTNHFEAMITKQDTIIVNMDYSGLGDNYYALVFFDNNGHEVRRLDYQYPGLEGNHWALGLARNDDRVFAHFAIKPDIASRPREIVQAYDSSWNVLWEFSVPNTFLNPTLCDIEAAEDGGVIALYSSFETSGRKMATIEKYDANGTMEWQTPLPHIGGFNSGWVRLDNHPDGGYVGI